MSRAYIASARFYLVIACVLLAFGVIAGRLFYLHVWEQDKLLRILERNRQKFEVLAADRGDIVDSRGNILATTRSVIELGVDPQMVKREDLDKLPQLAKILNEPLAALSEKVETKIRYVDGPDGSEIRLVRWVELADAVDEDTYERILGLGIRGVYGNRKFERVYPSGALASHVLGFVNKEDVASMGVERTMDFYLRGQHGWLESERDGRRRELAQFRSREVEPSNGFHVELTLDLMVQNIIEEELKHLEKEYAPKGATIIVSEPSTGFVLGLANYPSFNPNEFWKYPLDSHRNRAITDVYEPGSTFKIVPIAAVLNEELIGLDDMIDCGVQTVEYRGRPVKLPKDHRPFDSLSVHDVITKSSNRGVARLAMMVGNEGLYDYARAFGFGESTGLESVGEVNGMLHPVQAWDGLTISRMPMGHAVSATPMQVHYATSVIANQGVLMEPQLVRRVFDDMGETVLHFNPHAKRRVIKGETAKKVVGLMADTADSGTAKRAKIPGYKVAGKSGTSQKIINRQYSHSQHIASFSGFFPADSPRFVITIVVDDAQVSGTAWGGLVAAPAFKRIAEALIHYYGIQPEGPNKMFAWKSRQYDSI